MLARVLAVTHRVSVRLFVCHMPVLCQTAKRRITQTTPRDSPGTSFLMSTVVGRRRPIPPEIVAQSDLPTFEHSDFDQYPLIVPQL